MIKYQTLHAHTTTSDGKLQHLQLLDACEENNVGVVAFTDHDSLPSNKNLNLLKKNKSHLTKWIVGIELSSGLPKEIGDKAASSLHVVGLFVDPSNKPLLDHCVKAKLSREDRMEKIVKNLSSIGIKITKQDCLHFSNGEAVGRPHIVSAINSYEENKKVVKKLAKNMQQKSKFDLQVKEKYQEMKRESVERHPYYLFLAEDAFIKGVYVDYLYYKSFDDSVKLIREAGGVAFLAHWFTSKKIIEKKLLEKILQENRLDGLDTVCGLWTGGRLPKQ